MLLAVLKNGATSTLSIIAGIKERVEELRKTLPENLSIALLGDQSLFVEGAVSGVAFEAALAAVLSGDILDAMTVAGLLRLHHMAVTGALAPDLASAVLATVVG